MRRVRGPRGHSSPTCKRSGLRSVSPAAEPTVRDAARSPLLCLRPRLHLGPGSGEGGRRREREAVTPLLQDGGGVEVRGNRRTIYWEKLSKNPSSDHVASQEVYTAMALSGLAGRREKPGPLL